MSAIWLPCHDDGSGKVPESFEDFKERVAAERSVRKQRDAAERQISGERLRREIREAFDAERPTRPEPADGGDREATPPPAGTEG
jgi:hypothetical protein